jgi:ATP-dependent RNA helicase MSS116, mitochondrial
MMMQHHPSPADDEVAVDYSSAAGAARSQHQFSMTKFVDLDDTMISPESKRALTEVLKYEYMTKVQEATLPTILDGVDVVAKAKTGSGKTTGTYAPLPRPPMRDCCPDG